MESNTILYKPLGDVIELLTDYHANGAYEKLKENVTLLDKENHAVMIRTTNFEANDFTNNLIYIDEHAYEFLKKSKVYASDLIMNKIANPGTVYFMPEISKPVSLGMNLFLIRINPKKANPYFIYAYLRKNEYYVKSFASGSTTKTITKDDVRRLKIYTPPLAEQNKIAQILSTWDQAISSTEKLLGNSQEQKKVLMQQLLTGKKRLLDENGVEFSGEWSFLTFDELFIVANKKSAQIKSSDYLVSGSIPIVDQGQKFIAGYCDSKEVYSNIPVVVFGDHTRCIKWVDFSFCPGADGTQVLDVNKGIDKKFAYYVLLNTPIPNLGYSRHMRELKEKDFKIPLDLKEQIKISKFLSLVDQEIDSLQRKLDCLKQEKKALMQQLLIGKKRVKVAA